MLINVTNCEEHKSTVAEAELKKQKNKTKKAQEGQDIQVLLDVRYNLHVF